MFQLTQHTKSLVDTEWISALSPTRRNVQTTTKLFVDKRRPRQNGVPDRHVGNKLSFQVEHFESTAQLCPLLTILLAYKIIGQYGVDFCSLPNVMCFRGCISRSAVKSSVVLEGTHPITSRLPPGVLLNGTFYNTMNKVDSRSLPNSMKRPNHNKIIC